jgi:hypothetical protein
MKSLEWRDYMRELLKMSDEAIMRALGTSAFHRDLAEKWICGVDFAWTDGVVIQTPCFSSGRSHYIEVIPKIKVEFECEKLKVELESMYLSQTRDSISIVGTISCEMHELDVEFSSHEEQEKVFKKLIEAFGG